MFFFASTHEELPLSSVKNYDDSVKEIAPEESSWAPEIVDSVNRYSKSLMDIGRSPLINSLIIQVFHHFSEKKINDLTLNILGSKFSFRYPEGFNSSMYTVEKFQIVRSFVLLSLVIDWHKKISKYMEQFEGIKQDSILDKIDSKDNINVIIFQESILNLLKELINNCVKCLEEYFKNEGIKQEFQKNSLASLYTLFSNISNFSGVELKDNKIDVNFVSISASQSAAVFSQKVANLVQQNWHIILNESKKEDNSENILTLTAWINHCLKGKDFDDCICTVDLINSLILGTIKKDNIENEQNNKIILGLHQNSDTLKDIRKGFASEVYRILSPVWDLNFVPVQHSDRIPENEWTQAKEKYTYNIENKGQEEAKQAISNQLNAPKGTLKYASLLLLGAPFAAYSAYGKKTDDETDKQASNVSRVPITRINTISIQDINKNNENNKVDNDNVKTWQ